MTRSIFALIALTALPAFAPAPFPRPQRGRPADSIGLAAFQGKWKHARIEWVLPGGQRREWQNGNVVAVRVKGDVWTYLEPDDRPNASYSLTVEDRRGPAAIDWYAVGQAGQGAPSMLGLIRRDGDVVRILGSSSAKQADRPKDWDAPPNGWWLMTLERIE